MSTSTFTNGSQKTWEEHMRDRSSNGIARSQSRRPLWRPTDHACPRRFLAQYHSKSRRLLGLGVTFYFMDDRRPIHAAPPKLDLSDVSPELSAVMQGHVETCYATFDPEKQTWSPLKMLDLPQHEPRTMFVRRAYSDTIYRTAIFCCRFTSRSKIESIIK